MKHAIAALAIFTFLATIGGFAGVRDEPIPINYVSHDFDGTTLTVHLANSSPDPASATLTVYVMNGGAVVDTLVAPISLPGNSTGSILFSTGEGHDPFDPLGFSLN